MKKNEILTYFSDASDGNIAYHVGLSLDDTKQNRVRLCLKFGVDESKLIYMNQTHSDNIIVVNKNSPTCIDNCDAILTKEFNLPLMVMVADCIPILLYDSVVGVIGAVHSGRNGTFLRTLEKTILKIVYDFGSDINDIHIIFGSHIGLCCYEVSSEMASIVSKNFGNQYVNGRNIDLLGINLIFLTNLGINKSNIMIDKTCTFCGCGNYFSYRKEKNTGRFCGVICKK